MKKLLVLAVAAFFISGGTAFAVNEECVQKCNEKQEECMSKCAFDDQDCSDTCTTRQINCVQKC